jgi:hypothetical protein
VALLQRKGISTDGYYSKSWNDLPVTPDVVITVCGSGWRDLPGLSRPVLRAHWGVDDPGHVVGTEEEIEAAFEKPTALSARASRRSGAARHHQRSIGPHRMLNALLIFVATLVLVIWQPRGLGIGWSASGRGGGLAGGVIQVSDIPVVWHIIWNATATLVCIIITSLLLDKAGFFEWAALHVARWGGGSGKRLFVLLVLLGPWYQAVCQRQRGADPDADCDRHAAPLAFRPGRRWRL